MIAAVRASEISRDIVITVTGMQVFMVRWAIAAWIFRLGGVVAGCSVVVETTEP